MCVCATKAKKTHVLYCTAAHHNHALLHSSIIPSVTKDPTHEDVTLTNMRSFGSLRAHRVVLVILVCFLAAILLVLALPYRYNVQDALSYSTRPLWDTPETPRSSITHLQAAGVPANDSNSCSRHGWSPRQPGVALWDATLISTELDMLEIRLRELWDTVDLFLVMESTHTMTGIRKKRMFYEENQARFLPWRAKIRYKVFHGREARKGDGLFTLANEQRRAMGAFIDEQGPPPGTLVIMADVDEIPSHATAELIKACDSPLPLHLQLQNYLYSFEFATMADSWRAQVHSWDDAKGRDGYSHGRSTDHILTASGWHCR